MMYVTKNQFSGAIKIIPTINIIKAIIVPKQLVSRKSFRLLPSNLQIKPAHNIELIAQHIIIKVTAEDCNVVTPQKSLKNFGPIVA
jgi:hypothetical protein